MTGTHDPKSSSLYFTCNAFVLGLKVEQREVLLLGGVIDALNHLHHFEAFKGGGGNFGLAGEYIHHVLEYIMMVGGASFIRTVA